MIVKVNETATPRADSLHGSAVSPNVSNLLTVFVLLEQNSTLPMPPVNKAIVIALALAGAVLLWAQRSGPEAPQPAQASTAPFSLVATPAGEIPFVQRPTAIAQDVNAIDPNGFTPLMRAAQSGDLGEVRRLLDLAAMSEMKDIAGRTALHHAVLAVQPEIMEVLLPLTPALGESPSDLVSMACETADVRILLPILNRAPADLAWTPQTRSALAAALAAEDVALAQLLLSRHHSPPTVADGTTPLLAQAIASDNRSVFETLLAAGADPNTVLPTPPDKAFVSLVTKENLRSYLRGDEGVTVLMIAAGMGKSEYVRSLLAAGADKNCQTARHRMLAIYFAAKTSKAKLVQMLLGRGPDPDQLRVEISLATQRASIIKGGVSILKTPISTGRKGFDTPAGEFVVTDKKRSHRSSLYHVEMPFFMRLNCADFGLHAGAVPNYPASHGCIRLPAEMAQKVFSEVPIGTMVTIN